MRAPVIGRRPSRKAASPEGKPGTVAPLAPIAAAWTFKDHEACLPLRQGLAVAAVAYDHIPLSPDRWKVTEDGEQLAVACPPAAFDADQHVLSVQWHGARLAPLEQAFRSAYRANLEVENDRLRGWIHDELRPTTLVQLQASCGERQLHVSTSWRDAGVTETGPPVGCGAFEIAVPAQRDQGMAEWIVITVAETGYQPIGPVLRGGTLAAVTAASAAARALGSLPTGRLFGATLLPALIRSILTPPRSNMLALRGPQSLPRLGAPEIDVIVPVYRGLTETLACLRSVLAADSRIRHRVLVIDDASPEPELRAELDKFAAAGRIHVMHNERNVGFVTSINRGIAQSRTADVVLLNADTEVPKGFLERLYRAAYSDPMIATVTPLSNNATAFSLPWPPGSPTDPWGLPCQELDSVCAAVNARTVRDIPTAHGFCMFIKRAALDDVGLFDAETFGMGYGEENDFSLRAVTRGWRNVCAADVYIRHVGAVSFGAAPERDAQLAAHLEAVGARYPFYPALIENFLRTDPLHDLRNNVQKALWRRHRQMALIVNLAIGGGTARHADDLACRLEQEGWLVLELVMGRDTSEAPQPTLRRPGTEEALRYPATAPLHDALADILDLAPRFIHVQHLIDLPDGIAEFILDAGIPYAVTLHDFFYACPRVTLLDLGMRYCGMPPAARCTLCVRQGPVHQHVHPSLLRYAAAGEEWRGKWARFLRGAAQLIAPSNDTAERYRQLFPGLAISVRPHFSSADAATANLPALRPRDRCLRVAVPGALGPSKGVLELLRLAGHCSRWADDILFVVAGYTDRDGELERFDNVRLMGPYRSEEAVPALVNTQASVALLLNVFPETFSYTLSEVLAAGLTPVAYDFGAIGERLRALDVGITVPLLATADQLVEAIRAAARRPPPIPAAALYGEYETLAGDYYAPPLSDLIEVSPAPDQPRLLGRINGLHADGWCDGEVLIRVWTAGCTRRVALDFWVPDDRAFQAVDVLHDSEKAQRELIEGGTVHRVIVPIPAASSSLLELRCRFAFVARMTPPDIRACAAMLVALHAGVDRGWLRLELSA